MAIVERIKITGAAEVPTDLYSKCRSCLSRFKLIVDAESEFVVLAIFTYLVSVVSFPSEGCLGPSLVAHLEFYFL